MLPLRPALVAAFGLCLLPAAAFGWQVQGHVLCDGILTPLAGVEIKVESTDLEPPFVATAVSDASGYYQVDLPDEEACYRATALVSGSDVVVTPASGHHEFCATWSAWDVTRDFVIASTSCAEELCWLTGGGAKFSAVTGAYVAEVGRRHNFGGNVYPGCSPTAGDGGQWNHIEDALKLHFQGFHVEVIRCGNVDGIPPGSESPVTPYNFIEFEGTGRVQGIRGNKVDYPEVYFWARCEDRNEPGSSGAKEGALIDRYYLHVFTDPSDPAGSTLILVDEDGTLGSVDPVPITHGNLQIHISSCDSPPLLGLTGPRDARLAPAPVPTALPDEVFLTRLGAQPGEAATVLRFGLPRDADVSLRVFDVTGRAVRELAAARYPAGVHAATWDLRGADGRPVAGGIYFARLAVEGRSFTQRVFVR